MVNGHWQLDRIWDLGETLLGVPFSKRHLTREGRFTLKVGGTIPWATTPAWIK